MNGFTLHLKYGKPVRKGWRESDLNWCSASGAERKDQTIILRRAGDFHISAERLFSFWHYFGQQHFTRRGSVPLLQHLLLWLCRYRGEWEQVWMKFSTLSHQGGKEEEFPFLYWDWLFGSKYVIERSDLCFETHNYLYGSLARRFSPNLHMEK